MISIKQFIEKFKNLLTLYSINSLSEFEDAFSTEYPDDWEEIKCVSNCQNIHSYRWFSVATNVYMLEDGFVGVTAGYELYSEMMIWSDTDIIPSVNEYEAFTTIAYRRKLIN